MRRRTRRVGRRRRQRVYSYVRTNSGTFTAPGGSLLPAFGSSTIALNQLPNSNEFTSLYDQYRINGVSVRFVPRTSVSALAAGERGNFYSVIDYDDSVLPTSVNEMFERPNCKRTTSTSVHKRYFKPAIAVPMYKTAVAFGYGPKWKTWIDISNPEVPHYAIKWAIENWDSSPLVYDVYWKVYFQCKNVR